MELAKGSEGTEMRWGLAAVGEKLVRRGAVYVLICENKGSRVTEKLTMAESQRKKKKPDCGCRAGAWRERKSSCVYYEKVRPRTGRNG